MCLRWSDLLASAVNAWGVGRQPDTIPHQIHEPWMALYFVFYDAIIYLVSANNRGLTPPTAVGMFTLRH